MQRYVPHHPRRLLLHTSLWATILVAVLGLALGLGLPPNAAAETTTSSLIVKLVPGLSPAEQAAVIARNGGVETSSIAALRLHVVEVATADLAAVLASYQADPQVERVEENRVRRAEAVPLDPFYSSQWALPQIGWDLVYGAVNPAGSAVVALLDTGVDAGHPDLAGQLVPGTSILAGGDPQTDPSGHGTWLAGIIAARTDNVPVEGIAGVAYAGVQIMPVTVLDAGGEGRDSDVIAGVLWAADNGANVILMAFSNPGFSPNLQDALDYAWSRGVVLVAAVGNDGADTPTFPAGHRGVIGVSATDPADALAAFSNFGQAAFLAAPGVGIAATDLGDTYAAVTGTSASAAIVAGVAAFLKAVDPTLTNGAIVGRLARNADPAGTQAETGNGRVNMARALEDTSTEEVQPAGADPVGDGGPFVGPYVAASHVVTTITGSPSNPSASTSATFTWTTSVVGATSQCQIDGGGFAPCSSGITYSGLGAGSHTFQVRSRTAADPGGQGATASYTWEVVLDTTPPVITANVSGTLGNNGWYRSDVTVNWSVNDPESTVTSTSGCGPTTINADTAGQTLTCTATSAGGTSSQSVTIKRDATAPTVSASASPAPNGAGWNNSDVTVSFSCNDNLSGVASCGPNQTLSSDGAGQSATGTVVDNAGNTATTTASGINIDKTAPSVSASASPAPNGNGWNNTDVTVSFSGTDSLSGIDSCDAAVVLSGEGAGQSATGSCTDLAGNSASATVSGINIDKTAPSVSANASPAPNGNGWNNTDVTVTFSGTDSLSGIDSCDAAVVLSSEGAGQSASGSCTDKAGNSASATASGINIDKTAPSVSASASPAPNGNGWNNTNVTVSFSGTDGLSGIDSCSAAVVLSGDGAGQSATGSCTDLAGNSASATASNINIDKTPPTVSCQSPPPVFILSSGGSVSATVADSTSGPDNTPISAAADTSTVGAKTVSLTGYDVAGNSKTESCGYSVNYNFNGFFRPVDNPGPGPWVFNRVKAGSAVPVKFSLSGNQGLAIFMTAYPQSAMVGCTASGTETDLTETVTAGGSSLSYDATIDHYNYVWKTDKMWAGTCRKLTVRLNDGTDHVAYFNFTK